MEPFRRFIFTAAQMSGQIVNFSRIAREAGITVPTAQSYFQILADTLVGFLLEPFHESVRKRQRGNPKFYFFDTGIQAALSNALTVGLAPRTYAFGGCYAGMRLQNAAASPRFPEGPSKPSPAWAHRLDLCAPLGPEGSASPLL